MQHNKSNLIHKCDDRSLGLNNHQSFHYELTFMKFIEYTYKCIDANEQKISLIRQDFFNK